MHYNIIFTLCSISFTQYQYFILTIACCMGEPVSECSVQEFDMGKIRRAYLCTPYFFPVMPSLLVVNLEHYSNKMMFGSLKVIEMEKWNGFYY